jgi:actin-like ATPase involved in cell morphogenesis
MSQIISLDIGTGFVKACSVQKKVRFPSLYAYRDADPWENNKKGTTIVDGAGYDAVEITKHPSAVLLRPIREGTPSNKTAFMAVINQAIKRLEISNDSMPETSIIIGLPYHAAKDAIKFPRFVKKITNCKDVMVVPQTIGTLMSSKKKDAIILAIGQGTTELVAYDNLKPILGRSIPQACDYIHLGADELQYLNNSNKSNLKRV